jgi:predicted O-linked N-acetylglucosamine transferase (SPINDLY family)
MCDLLLPPMYESMEDLHAWRKRLIENLDRLHREGVVFEPARESAEPLFYLAYQGLNDRDIQRAAARLYVPAPGPEERPAGGRPGGTGKIRIGFLSRHLKNHTIGRLMRGLIAQLSRELFSVTVLTIGTFQDWLADFIKQHADNYIALPINAQAARRVIAQQNLDVLFFTDVGMESVSYSLSFSRLAPVQCVTWGHPTTTGSPNMDYFISSVDLDTEEATEHYTETLVRPRTMPIYYYRPQLSEKPRGRAEFGLPEDRHLYSCPQSLFKFHPEFDDILGRILRADPLGLLVLLEPTHAYWREVLLKRFSPRYADVVDRIKFIPRLSPEAFLELNAFSNVLLDPIHFGGGNTSYEGFAVGTPIVTLPSPFLRGRITYAQYKQMGVSDCIVKDADEYVDLTVKLGTDPEYRAMMRDKILASCGVLYENATGVRELEQFLQQAVAKAAG